MEALALFSRVFSPDALNNILLFKAGSSSCCGNSGHKVPSKDREWGEEPLIGLPRFSLRIYSGSCTVDGLFEQLPVYLSFSVMLLKFSLSWLHQLIQAVSLKMFKCLFILFLALLGLRCCVRAFL